MVAIGSIRTSGLSCSTAVPLRRRRLTPWNAGPATDQLAVGDRLGPFVLQEPLGAGGMGIVFRALREDGVEVALKVLREELAGDETFRRRFDHEARSARPKPAPRRGARRRRGRRPLLPRQRVRPRTDARRRRARGGPLPLDDVARVAAELASALDALHDAGLVHRDVKASNVLMRDGVTAMLTDFGLAKGEAYTVAPKPGQVMGTSTTSRPS